MSMSKGLTTSWSFLSGLAARSGVALALLGLLAGCGGGGGGGGSEGMQIRFDRSSLSLTAQENDSAGVGAQVILATASGGSASDSLYVGAEVQGTGVLQPIAVEIDTGARTARITVAPNTSQPVGTYSGTVRLLACKDQLCATHHAGSPFTVSYTTVITPRFKASAASLSFTAVETVQPAAQVLQVTLPQGVAGSTAAVEYGAGVSPWLQVTAQGQDYAVRPQAGLAVGDYSAVLRLEAGGTHAPVRIPVQVRISAGLVVPVEQAITIDSRSPASAAAGELAIGVAAGVNAGQWAATSSQPWLRLVSSTGALGTALRWQIEPQAFLGLLNQATHDASVTVTAPGTGLASQTWRLRLTKDMAELVGSDALPVLAGEAGELVLYGRRLDQLQQPASQVVGTGFVPQQVNLRSANMISVQVPALVAGSYEVTLQTASGLPTRAVRLHVLAPQERQQVWVNTSGQKGALLWDAVNGTAFAVDLAQRAVLRIEPTTGPGGDALALSSRTVPGLAGIALSPDRRSLIATTESGQLLTLSPQDLATLSTRDLGRTVGPQWPAHLPQVVTGDAWLLATGGNQWAPVLSYDLLRSAVAPLNGSSSYTFYSGPWGLVSPNGQRALVTQTAGLSPAPGLLRRDAVDGALSTVPTSSAPSFFYQVASDRRGTRWVLDNRMVVDFDLNTLGELPQQINGNWIALTAAISRDGSRTYVYTVNGTVSDSMIFVFDTRVAVGAGRQFPLLGQIQPWLSPSCLSPNTSDSCNGYASRMVLMDDDRTLMLAGDRRIGLVPVPAGLRGGVPAAQGARAPHAVAVGRQ